MNFNHNRKVRQKHSPSQTLQTKSSIIRVILKIVSSDTSEFLKTINRKIENNYYMKVQSL